MTRYDHLPIYRTAFDLAVHLETVVKNFSRYHKYTLGTELRERSRRVLEHIVQANSSREREPLLLALRQELEWLKVLTRLSHEAGAFASTRAYFYVSEQIVAIAKQNEGWLRYTGQNNPSNPPRRKRRNRSGEAGPGLVKIQRLEREPQRWQRQHQQQD